MDDIDIASERSQRWIDNCLAATRKQPPANNVRECRSCGDNIPEARKKAVPHTVFCIECATIEKK